MNETPEMKSLIERIKNGGVRKCDLSYADKKLLNELISRDTPVTGYTSSRGILYLWDE